MYPIPKDYQEAARNYAKSQAQKWLETATYVEAQGRDGMEARMMAEYFEEQARTPARKGEEVRQQKLEWKRAGCPICGQEYEYLESYKPKTCSKFSCLQEALRQGILSEKAFGYGPRER